MDDLSYTAGSRRAWLLMLQECLRGLGEDDPVTRQHAWILERQEALAVLRRICASHGDNEWPDDLHLADILEKHVEPYLDQAEDA